MARIDDVLPTYDAVERHAIGVDAPPEIAFDAVRNLELARSPVIAMLLAVRGLPHLFTGRVRPARRLDLDAILGSGFVLLADDPPHEIVLGVVGQFWRLTSGIRPIAPPDFAAFQDPGFAKGVWNFTVEPDGAARSIVRTETRVACTDEAARRKFRRYWRVVGPFSGLIRILLLRSIKRAAEDNPTSR